MKKKMRYCGDGRGGKKLIKEMDIKECVKKKIKML